MSAAAANRSKLAFAALAAIVIPTFLPVLHAIPGLGHGDCACSLHRSHGHAVRVGEATCGHAHDGCGHSHGHVCGEHAKSTREAPEARSKATHASPAWTVRQADDHGCLLCDLFADFLLTKPENGFVSSKTDAIESHQAPDAFSVGTAARSSACRGPPVAV